jgi:hypothetical protein
MAEIMQQYTPDPEKPGARRIDYYQHPQSFVLGQNPKTMPYGPREDMTPKGEGFFGKIPRTDHPKMFSTELSASTDFKINGRTVLFPLLVPTLTKEEIDGLVSGKPVPDDVYRKAEDFAKARLSKGLSPFASPGEQVPLPTSQQGSFRQGFQEETEKMKP